MASFRNILGFTTDVSSEAEDSYSSRAPDLTPGAIHLHCCPAERYIPIYLIVSGCFTIVKYLASLIQKCTSRDLEEQSGNVGLACLDGILGCFLFAWFICGNVWIYRTYGHFSTDSDQPNFCHPTLFYFSFRLLNAIYIVVGLAAFLGCCVAITAACMLYHDQRASEKRMDKYRESIPPV